MNEGHTYRTESRLSCCENKRGNATANMQHLSDKVRNLHTQSSHLKELIKCLLTYLQLLEEVGDNLFQTSLLHQGQHTTVMLHLRQNGPEQRRDSTTK